MVPKFLKTALKELLVYNEFVKYGSSSCHCHLFWTIVFVIMDY